MSAPRIANAPLSYGAFEMTVGTSFPVPAGERVLAEVRGAGYEGIDLGPPRVLGGVETLAERLGGLALAGGFVPIAFSEDWDFAGLHATLDLFDAAGAAGAHPVLCDAGGPDRIANPGAGAARPLDGARWARERGGGAAGARDGRARGAVGRRRGATRPASPAGAATRPSFATTRRPTSRA